MSKELEARLREADVVDYPNTTQDLCEEAADQLERYRVALERIVEHCANDGYGNPIVNERIVDRCDETARQALEAK